MRSQAQTPAFPSAIWQFQHFYLVVFHGMDPRFHPPNSIAVVRDKSIRWEDNHRSSRAQPKFSPIRTHTVNHQVGYNQENTSDLFFVSQEEYANMRPSTKLALHLLRSRFLCSIHLLHCPGIVVVTLCTTRYSEKLQ